MALAVAAGAPVPAALVKLEHVAEALDDAVVGHDWVKVAALEREGERALGEQPRMAPASAHAAATRALADAQTATQHRQALATRRAANRLAAAVVGFYEPFRPTVPTSVMQLDVMLRQIDLAAVSGDLAEARTAFSQTMAIWTPMSTGPPIAGSRAAQTFVRQLADVQRAVASGRLKATERSAVKALEGVDGLEKVYESIAHAAR